MMKLRTMKVPVTVPSRTVLSAQRVNTSMADTMSVASIISRSHDVSPTSTEAEVFGRFEKAEEKNLSSNGAQRSKNETLGFDRLSAGSNFSDSSRKGQHVSSNRLRKQKLNLDLQSK